MPALHPNFMRTYPSHPDHAYPDISGHMADQINATHDLTKFPTLHDALIYVRGLLLYYKATREIGWIEHTEDWDWYVGITHRDGYRLGDDLFTGRDDGLLGDALSIRGDDGDPGNSRLYLMYFEGDPDTEIVRLRDVASITISRR